MSAAATSATAAPRPAAPAGAAPHRVDSRRPGCPASQHGTVKAYSHYRCRCGDAREAARIYYKRLREGRQPPAFVDVTGTRRRLHSLQVLGWPVPVLADLTGVPMATLYRVSDGYHQTVHRDTAAAVTRVFEQLSMTFGPSQRVRRRALRQGWVTPLAWDDIDMDDPAAEPDTGRPPPPDDLDEFAISLVVAGVCRMRLTKAEQRAAMQRMIPTLGLDLQEIADRVGWTQTRVQKHAARLGFAGLRGGQTNRSKTASA